MKTEIEKWIRYFMQSLVTPLPYTVESLEKEAMAQWSKISKEVPCKSMHLGPPKKEIKRAFEAYQNALNGPLPLILLGGPEIREEPELLKNFGSLATDSQVDQKFMKSFLKLTLSADGLEAPSTLKKVLKNHLTRGAIMCDSNWWIFRNDAFMLGGLHAGKEFHVVMKKNQNLTTTDIWDRQNRRPTVFGRELAMLMIAGYTKVDSSKHNFGMVFQPPCEEGKRKVTLSKCREKIANLKSVQEIVAAFDITLTRARAKTI